MSRLLGLSTHILSSWETNETIDKTSLRGKKRTFSDAEINFVVTSYKQYSNDRQRVKITAFMKHLRNYWTAQQWLTPCPSRKTVADILSGNGCRKVEGKSSKREKYYDPIKRYFPHVQNVMDGKEVVISFNGEHYQFVMEYSKDMATDAICGSSIGNSETAELVAAAFNNHCDNYAQPLATLVDNGSGNKKAAMDLGSEGTLFIHARPYRPQTKAQLEGEFGLFERNVSQIVIAGETAQEQAMSILENISRVYMKLRNETPRCSVCPFTPAKLMKADLSSVTANQAFSMLTAEQQKKKQLQQQRLKISQQKSELVDSIIKEHNLTGDVLRFKKSVRAVEISTLKKAEEAFYVQSKKDTFDEGKRNMAYFSAIARNLQDEQNNERREEIARRRYGLDQQSKKQRDMIANELSLQQQLINEPHSYLIEALKADLNLPHSIRKIFNYFRNEMDKALLSILNKKKYQQQILMNKIQQKIMSLHEFSLEKRYESVNYINDRISALSN